MFGQGFVVVVFRRVGRQLDEGFRTPISLAAVVIQKAAPDGLVRCLLVGLANGRVDAKALGVGLLRVLVVDRLTHHFGQEFAVEPCKIVDLATYVQGGLGRLFLLLVGDVSQFPHAAQHVLLALARALRISNRVVSRRRFRQPGKYRCLPQSQLVERLAEVDLGCRRKPVGALPQVYLIDVELEDLVLREVVLDFERQQRFIELARKRFLGGKEEIPGHLHGDRACALFASPLGEVGVGRAGDAEVVDSRVLIKPFVLRSKDRVLELLRNLLDRNERAALLAELADLRTLRGVNPHGYLGLIVRKYFKRRQIRIRKRNDQANQKRACGRHAPEKNQRERQKAKPNQRGYAKSREMLHTAGDTAHYRLSHSWKIH